MLLCLSWLKNSFHGRSCQQWQGHCMSSLAGVYWWPQVDQQLSGVRKGLCLQWLHFCTAPWGQHGSPAGQGSQQAHTGSQQISRPLGLPSSCVSAWGCAEMWFLYEGLWNHLCLYACSSLLPRRGTASSEQQERIYREVSIAYAIINSIFPISLYAFWLGLSLTPLAVLAAGWWVGHRDERMSPSCPGSLHCALPSLPGAAARCSQVSSSQLQEGVVAQGWWWLAFH